MFWFLFVTSFLWSWVAGLTVWEGGGEEVCHPLSHCKQSKIDSLPSESLHCGVEYFVQNRYPIFFKFSSRENLAKANWSFAAVLNHIQAETCTALISPTDKSGSHWKSILASSFLKMGAVASLVMATAVLFWGACDGDGGPDESRLWCEKDLVSGRMLIGKKSWWNPCVPISLYLGMCCSSHGAWWLINVNLALWILMEFKQLPIAL